MGWMELSICAQRKQSGSKNQETLWPVEVEGLGKYVHDYVNGVEDLFIRIAKKIDQDIPAGPHWHRDLILRMAKEIPGVRPPGNRPGAQSCSF